MYTDHWPLLANALRRHASEHPIVSEVATAFGTRYVVDGILHTLHGRTPRLRVVWFIDHWRRGAATGYGLSIEERPIMIHELDEVVLTVPIPDLGLMKGDLGTVVLVHDGGRGYEVEFVTLDGATVAVITALADQVRAINPARVRPTDRRPSPSRRPCS